MYFRLFFYGLFFVSFSVARAHASDFGTVHLTVDAGFPLQVSLTEKLRFKEGESVHGVITEPVYVFDREVIPSGTRIEGRIAGFREAGKLKRFFSILSGDFTPKRTPEIVFDTIVFSNGGRISIDTLAEPRDRELVIAPSDAQHAALHEDAFRSSAKSRTKSRVGNFLWSLSPYRPQNLPSGAQFTATLQSPLRLGEATFPLKVLDSIGAAPESGSILSARLTTPLDSRTAVAGAAIYAVLLKPVFASADKRMLLPAGSIVEGEVIEAIAARKLSRNAELAVKFTRIHPPAYLQARGFFAADIAGTLAGVEAGETADDAVIGTDGAVAISRSKTRFLRPAYSVAKAAMKSNDNPESFDQALVGAYRSRAAKGILGSDPGLGLTGSISGAMVPPIGIGLGVFSAVRSVYSTFIGRGQDIVFAPGTLVEVQVN